ncbi:MAG: MucR family transcriptional regulator [Rhizobiales bacterium]|nr:MucR family transcriptional regulator [Hyphomicrobiales bacterium]
MSDQIQLNTDERVELTAQIVSAYVGSNKVGLDALADLISSVDATLKALALPTQAAAPVELVPAISIKKSITSDFIVCLEDGKRFKSLKRHLRTAHGLSPDQYRTKWGLPADYPMVAPNYAAARSALAKSSGLGQQRRKATATVAKAPKAVAPAKPAAKGRKAKA